MPKKYKDLDDHEQKACDEAFDKLQERLPTADALSFVSGWLAANEYWKERMENMRPPGIYRGEFPVEDL